ncbi:MAG TPA: hypothetical protein PLY11_13420, partial [Syntrophorhabdus sp.]|nr:hypothetical protein [Syntrophorhabdus sp.]
LEPHITPPHSSHLGRSIPLFINIIIILMKMAAGNQLPVRLCHCRNCAKVSLSVNYLNDLDFPDGHSFISTVIKY